MRKLALIVPLVVVLAVSIWYAAQAWTIDAAPMPLIGYVAMAGGVIFSLIIGCGLMALVFYSNRHGYDDAAAGPFEGETGYRDPGPPRSS